MLKGPVIKHTAGTSPWFLIQVFQVHWIGDRRRIPQDGGHFGPPYQKHEIPVMSLLAMAARRGAEGGCKCVEAALKCPALCSCDGALCN